MGFKDGRLTRRQAAVLFITATIVVILLGLFVIPNL